MLFSKFQIFLSIFFLSALSQTPVSAVKKSYIVYMGAHSHGPEITEEDLRKVSDSHFEFLGSFLGSKAQAQEAIFHSYRRHINGFAAILDEKHAAEIAKHPKVVSVFLNQKRQLLTTHSWKFLSLENGNGSVDSNSLWKKANYGEDIIIGNLDTGVWPESKSFSDEGYGPIPSRWKGDCATSKKFHCNRKLIGARFFNKGVLAIFNLTNSSFSAVDNDGHGTHTLSTAGGNFVPGASVLGKGKGTVKGGAPRARVAAYKACWATLFGTTCYDVDVLDAFDVAIQDGVDVLSVSLGGSSSSYFDDSISIGAFHAVQRGIVVICAAGNSGPEDISNVAPWIITVAASTTDRDFAAYVRLKNGQLLKGASLSRSFHKKKFHPLISGVQAKAANASDKDALNCDYGALDPKKAKGKIVVCLSPETVALTDQSQAASSVGAVGTILCNDQAGGSRLFSQPHIIPTSHINYTSGLAVFAYVNSTNNPQGIIEGPIVEFGVKPSPVMAPFSSQGPNTITPEILKPDITAPGVDIIAAFPGNMIPFGIGDKRRTSFLTDSGTSMACPHVSGIVGLLKAIHPDWSPAAIRSAIMTTARTRDNTGSPILNGSLVKATPFDYGSGHIQPNLAADPGLVYDLTAEDYKHFICALGYNKTVIKLFTNATYTCSKENKHLHLINFNYPSIAVPKLVNSVTVTRRLKNVGSPGKYSARIDEPVGVSVSVEPKSLIFEKRGEEKTFNLTLKAKRPGVVRNYTFGELIWSDSVHYVKSPIVVAIAKRLDNS